MRQLGHREVDLHARAHAAVGADPDEERGRQVGLVAQRRNVRFGSAFDSTRARAAPRRPPSATPTARPPRVGSARPRRRSGSRRRPRAPRPPSSPSARPCRRARTPIGARPPPAPRSRGRAAARTRCRAWTGPATLSLIACQPSAAFTCSDSNRSARSCVTRCREQERELQQVASMPEPDAHPAQQLEQVVRRRTQGQAAFVRRPAAPRPRTSRARSSSSRQGVGVRRREPARLSERRPPSSPTVVVRAVGDTVERGPGGVDVDAATHELHVAPDRLAEHRQDVRAGGGAEPGGELLGDARPPTMSRRSRTTVRRPARAR